MPLLLNDNQVMLRDTARPFLAKQAPVSHLRALRDSDDPRGFSRDLWSEFGAMGFTGVLFSEEVGGLGLGHVEAGVVLEEIGRNLTPSPFLSTAIGAGAALAEAGANLKARWLPPILTGEAVVAVAVDETARHHPERIGLRAYRSGAGFRLDGVKTFVPHGHIADLVIVAARTSGSEMAARGVTLFAIPADSTLHATPARLIDASLASDLRFAGIAVGADSVIGQVDQGGVILSRTLDALRVGAAAEQLGVGYGAMERTVAYLKERRQFGVAIGSFQALQHRLADMLLHTELARSMSYLASAKLAVSDATERRRAISAAKFLVGRAARFVGQQAVQLHGGMGVSDELATSHYFKRLTLINASFGDMDHHLARFGSLMAA